MPANSARRSVVELPRLDMAPEERRARGKEARSTSPRAAHGDWKPDPARPDPVALLEEQGAKRLAQLLPIRHGRMLASPFAFFRGGALVMASDLAGTPDAGVTVQLCGDAHLSNFGLFASPERQMLFDINDFDETLPGPWEWDVKRLAASFEIAGRELGFSAADRRDVVLSSVREYRLAMARAAQMGVLEAWYAHLTADDLLASLLEERAAGRLGAKQQQKAERVVEKARSRVHRRSLDRLTAQTEAGLRIVAGPPLIVPLEDLVAPGTTRGEIEAWMYELIATYRRSLADQYHPIEEFRYVDTALKVVGVGSVGTRCWILLFVGRDHDNPLFLQAKEAPPSVLERYVGRSSFRNAGQRVVVGQRLMQSASDIFLGWLRLEGLDGVARDFYVRQLHDWKGAVDPAQLGLSGAQQYARLCGATLARAHARHGDRIAIAAYLGRGDGFDRAVARFASAYADQNERDYEAFAAAVKTGRVEATTGL